MGILIDSVRIANFRAIKNLEVNLSSLTMLVGANNSGKTSFLRALHLALGYDRRMVNIEDVHDSGNNDPHATEIVVDIRITSVDENGKRMQEFEENWGLSDEFSGKVKVDDDGREFLAFRTRYLYDTLSQMFKPEWRILKKWPSFDHWLEPNNEDSRLSKLESIPLIFVDAQRDIHADLRDRNSFLGKLTNKPDIDPDKIAFIENQIKELNNEIIDGSANLRKLREKLKDLNKTVFSKGAEGVEISPVNKKIRDIGRNLNINFNDIGTQSFPLEYHGMGTRSWASLLTLNAFISWQQEVNNPYFPILALEEPEAHLHPNAQRQLYQQLSNMKGQKIISTHSPFIAAQCDLMELRHFYKDENSLKVGQLKISEEGKESVLLSKALLNKLNYFVIQNRGEILFSRAIVLMEGATEEQSLPYLYFEKTGRHPYEHGVNFISADGKNYLPFLLLADFLNIKWYILSDGDNKAEDEVKAQIKKIDPHNEFKSLFVLDNSDFEEYLVNHDYGTLLQNAINKFYERDYFPSEYINEFDQQKMKGGKVRNYKQDTDGGFRRALIDCLRKNKFDFSRYIAQEIVKRNDENGELILPPKIDELFNKIAQDLKIDLP